MGLIIGMDEAGYGPNLGPLVVTATVWEVPGHPRDANLWERMAPAVHPAPPAGDPRLHVADSKAVYSPARGLAALERSVLAAAALWGHAPGTFHELRRLLTGASHATETELWFDGCDLRLPHAPNAGLDAMSDGAPAASRSFGTGAADSRPPVRTRDATTRLRSVSATSAPVEDAAARWRDCCTAHGIRLRAIRSDVVLTARFNRMTRECGNKSTALTQIGLRLLQNVWDADSAEPAWVIADKHGGRNRYDLLLQQELGRLVLRREEGRAISRYALGPSEIRFEARAESHLPVALASMVSKYVRELAMELFNRFWRRHVPGLRPTKGYPVDAARFRTEIAAAQRRLGIPDDGLWRAR